MHKSNIWYVVSGRQAVRGKQSATNGSISQLQRVYETWRKDLVKREVNVRLSTEMTQVVKRDKNGVVVRFIKRTPVPDNHNPNNGDPDAEEWEEEYDKLILCVL